jgi:hypothetical protein
MSRLVALFSFGIFMVMSGAFCFVCDFAERHYDGTLAFALLAAGMGLLSFILALFMLVITIMIAIYGVPEIAKE